MNDRASEHMPTKQTNRQLYFRLLGFVRPYARQFAAGIGGMIIVALTEPALPAVLKPLLDEGFIEKNLTSIHWILGIMILLFLVRGIGNVISGIAIGWVAGRVELDIRRNMFDRLLVLPARFYDNHPTGNVISKVTYNVTQVTNAATKTLTVIVKDSVTVLGLLAYAIYINWQLTLVIFLAFPPIVLSVKAFARRMRRFSRAFQDSIGDMTHVLEEGVKGQKVIKVFGGQDQERRNFGKVANRARQLQYKVIAARTANVPVVEFITAVLFSAVVYIGTRQAIQDELSVGGLVAFFAAIGLMTSPIKRLTNASAPLQKGLAAAESIFALIDEEAEPDEGRKTLEQVQGTLAFDNVCFRYGPHGEPVLNNISFDVPAGTTVALVGPSGSGKSTIAALLPRFYEPSKGRILLDGVDITSLSLTSLRHHLALVNQDIVLFNDTLRANIAYGMGTPPTDDTIIAAAKAANAWEFIRGQSLIHISEPTRPTTKSRIPPSA